MDRSRRMLVSAVLALTGLVLYAGCGKEGGKSGDNRQSESPAGESAGGAGRTLTVDLGNGVTMKFVLIPAGRFMMGSPDSEAGHQPDETQHEVTISRPFYMGISEVTQEQWQAVMGTRPWDELVFFRESRTNPASCISWADATEFCKRLSAKPGQAGPPFRLPTEAEWEYACRAGTTTRFYFGDDESRLGDYAWWGKNTWAVHEQYSHAVGQKRPNGWGLHDMLGNVCEWCSDWYGDYSRGPVTDPAGPELGRVPVLRGGSWNDDAPENLRCADRIDRGPGNRLGGYGFRVARNLPP